MKNIIQMKCVVWIIAVLFGASSGSALSLACSNLGAGKHMGVVRMIDPIKGALSIIDAETRRPITFVTGENSLKSVHVNDTVVITFERDKDQLIAKEIVVHKSGLGLL